MAAPSTYREWLADAERRDLQSGAAAWRARDSSSLYDWEVIRRRHDELMAVRGTEDAHELLFYLHEGIHGNMGGMGSPKLYTRARAGTKHLISAYIGEITGALEQLATVPEAQISAGEKLKVLRRAEQCFGRSALMLSGAGSLGPFHMGVVGALAGEGVLPNVLSGASAGSLVAAVAGTHSQDQVAALFRPAAIAGRFADLATGSGAKQGGQLRVEDVQHLIAELVPDLTFEEAWEQTGRWINISVSPSQVHQRSRLLNAITSPNACLREAVLASCAVPGVFPPVTLAARAVDGSRKPYIASRKWVDGSMTDDMPARRLGRLYGVNHFISSQTNPLVLWAVRDTTVRDDLLARLLEVYQGGVRNWAQAVYPYAMQMVGPWYPFNLYTRMAFGLMVQQYTADVNILPRQRMVNPARLLAVTSPAQVRKLVQEGEQATWPKLEMIRNCTAVSRCLDGLLRPLEERALDAAA